MREFFVNENPVFLFKPFGLIHNLFTTTALLAAIIIFINRNKISHIKEKTTWNILRVGATILLINMFIYTFGNLHYGCFNYKEMLPFHLCFIANYMFMYAIYTKNINILRITIFMCFIGPIPAILWPELTSTIDNFNFWQLIISHHFFLNLSLFSYFALNYRVRKIDYIKTFILLVTLLLLSYPFNKLFDTNYIFTNYMPKNVVDLYPWVVKFPLLLVLFVLGFVISIIIYLILIVPRYKELDRMIENEKKRIKETKTNKRSNN